MPPTSSTVVHAAMAMDPGYRFLVRSLPRFEPVSDHRSEPIALRSLRTCRVAHLTCGACVLCACECIPHVFTNFPN